MFSLTFAFFNLAGFLESFYYDRLPRETIGGMKAQKNIKLQMVLSRVVFFIVLLLPALLLHRTSMYVCYVSCLCIYPYIHLGSYYSNRNKLNPNIYTDGWNSQESDTSTAFIDKAQDKLEKKYKIFNTIIIRQTLFLFGVILFILSVI
jgi:hypothetical protein